MDLPVGKHFSSTGHDVADMLVSVICAGFAGNTLQRCRVEARLIFHHETMHPKGMNVDFAFVYLYFTAACAHVEDAILTF